MNNIVTFFMILCLIWFASIVLFPDTDKEPIGYYQTDVGNLSAEFYACDFEILTNIERINIFDEENIPIKCNPERME